jgi:hypothetical protein
MLFVSRCQNLESEANPNGGKLNDGGFFYSVSSGGESPAGRAEENGPRSYGSMTYAGLKSLLYAGVKNDDPRVKAAVQWIEKNYTVTSNPGMGDNGLFYYYYLFAKSLDSLNRDYVIAPDGSRHDWRKELAEELFQSQTRNGSWVNSKSNRWMEGDPNLVTAYSLVALNFCSSKKSR